MEKTDMRIRSFTVFMLLTLFAAASFADDKKTQIISTSDAPAAIGPYSQAVKFSDFVFLAGQIPLDPATQAIINTAFCNSLTYPHRSETDFFIDQNDCIVQIQTRRVMDNIGAVLAAAGLDFCDIVMSTVYLADLNDFSKAGYPTYGFNPTYGQYFDDCQNGYYPARATVQAGIPRSGKLEIAVIAVQQKGHTK